MLIDLSHFNLKGKTVAVALSGGSDSVALLHYLKSKEQEFEFTLAAIHVNHGIRAEAHNDLHFSASLCDLLCVPIYTYTVDVPEYCKHNKLSIEEGARILRYHCFYDVIKNGGCDLVATAHHEDDNFETLLFNLFRGSGLKGVSGITERTEKGIIRPFLKVSKAEITCYINDHNLPHVTDETNSDDSYTRNYLRLNVIPEIKKVFPSAEKSGTRFCEIARLEDEYMSAEAEKVLTLLSKTAEIAIPCHRAIFNRAVILALKHLGVKKDWGKPHLDDSFALTEKENGKSVNLLDGIIAVKEYDKIVFHRPADKEMTETPFHVGSATFDDWQIENYISPMPYDLKAGFYADYDRIPKTAVIRTRRDGDVFTKFGGGSKSLGDYLTDKKIPLRERDFLPLLADGNEVLAIYGVAISDKIRVDERTRDVVELVSTPKTRK